MDLMLPQHLPIKQPNNLPEMMEKQNQDGGYV